MLNRTERFLRGAVFVTALLGLSGAAFAGSYEDAIDSAYHGRSGQLSELLERGIDPDTVGQFNDTLLIIAAREGHGGVVELLLRNGANPSHRNLAGDSALMLAVLKGNAQMAADLIEAGAEVNHEGWTPLLYAAFQGQLGILEVLLSAGADVNALAPNQANALMLASRNGHIEVVRRLLETDIDLFQETDRGYTAVSWALENRNTDIADLVRAAQAERSKSSALTRDAVAR